MRSLTIHGQPCRTHSASWCGEAETLAAVHATVRRQSTRLFGTVASGAVVASWQVDLTATSLRLELDLH
jgi:hypothetical protein